MYFPAISRVYTTTRILIHFLWIHFARIAPIKIPAMASWYNMATINKIKDIILLCSSSITAANTIVHIKATTSRSTATTKATIATLVLLFQFPMASLMSSQLQHDIFLSLLFFFTFKDVVVKTILSSKILQLCCLHALYVYFACNCDCTVHANCAHAP